MNKIRYVTLDTETYGGAANPKGIYDFGAVIHEGDKVLATLHFLVAEHFDKISTSHYGKKTAYRYDEMLERGEVSFIPTEDDLVDIVNKVLDYYGVRYVMAYNTSFDLCRTKCKALIENREFIDIYQMASEIIAPRPTYKAYCEENNFKTANGNCKCNVETVYGYLTNNPSFEEEHTAFSDACQEMEIFCKCRKAHKKYTKNKHKNEDFKRG